MNVKQNNDFDEAGLESTLQDIVRRIRSEVDPQELNKVRHIFKKNVPLFMRSYVAAYLLRYNSSKPPRRRPNASSTLFISIGKNRRVFPRDLVQMLITAGNLQKHEIGDIKILDNYSFVEVEEGKSAGVITLLDGTNFRGRRITVNFAKKRDDKLEDEESAKVSTGDDNWDNEDSQEPESQK